MKHLPFTENTMERFINENCLLCRRFVELKNIWQSGKQFPANTNACMVAVELWGVAAGVLYAPNECMNRHVVGFSLNPDMEYVVPLRCKSFCENKPEPKPIAKNQLSLL